MQEEISVLWSDCHYNGKICMWETNQLFIMQKLLTQWIAKSTVIFEIYILSVNTVYSQSLLSG